MPSPFTVPGLILSTTTSQRRANSRSSSLPRSNSRSRVYALSIGVQVKVESYSLGLVDLLIWLDDGDRQVDLNNLGAVVGQHFGAVRTGDPVGQLQHAYAIEGHLWQV